MNEIDRDDIEIILNISKKYGCPGKQEIISIFKLQKEQEKLKGKIGNRYLERLRNLYDFKSHDGKCIVCCKNMAIDGILCSTCHVSVESALDNVKKLTGCDANGTDNRKTHRNEKKLHNAFFYIFIVILCVIGLYFINSVIYINDLKKHVEDSTIVNNPEVRIVNDFCKAITNGDDEKAMEYVLDGKLMEDCPQNVMKYFGSFFEECRVSIDYAIMCVEKESDDKCEEAIVHVLFTYPDISSALLQTYIDFVDSLHQKEKLSMSDEQFADLYLKYSAERVPKFPYKASQTVEYFYCKKNDKEDKWVIENVPFGFTEVITCNYELAKDEIEFYISIKEATDELLSELSDDEWYSEEILLNEKAPKSGRYVNGKDAIIISLDASNEFGYVDIYSYSYEFGMDIWIDSGVMTLSQIDGEDYYYYLKTEQGESEYEILFGYDEIIVSDLSVEGGYYLDFYYEDS